MSLHLVAEAPGSWSIDLRPSTPHAVTQAIEVASHGFSTLVVTPTRVDAVGMVTTASVLHSLSVYAGLLRAQRNRLSLSGPGLWAALGNEQGVGPLIGSGLSATRTFAVWAANLDLDGFIEADAGLAAGPSYTWTSARVMTYREALESLVELTGLSLHIDPRTMTIKDSSQDWTLADQVNQPLLTPWFDGREVGDDRPLMRASFDTGIDLDDWLSAIIYTDAGGSSTTNGSNAYIYEGGVDADYTKYVSDTSTPSGYGATAAGAELDVYNEPGWSISATVDEPDVLSYLVPGSTVLAYDPENGVYDTAGFQALARGQMMLTLTLTVNAMRVPIRSENGVYVVAWDPTGGGGGGADSITDLSEWFIPEDGPATLELGRSRTRAVRTVTRRDGARRQ